MFIYHWSSQIFIYLIFFEDRRVTLYGKRDVEHLVIHTPQVESGAFGWVKFEALFAYFEQQ